MAKVAWINRAAKKPKFTSRVVRRCQRCGRCGGTYRRFELCRLCLRELAHRGEIPGLTKASW